jgi:nucleotide-binding universal stress UspA family protein
LLTRDGVGSPAKTVDIHRILCPTDFSATSARAFEHAVALAAWYEAALTILHVTSDTIVPFSEVAYIGNPMLMDPGVLDQTLSDLSALAAPARRIGLRADTEVREGGPAAEILDAARELPADLVVMGTHGRTGFERFVLGSVTETVLRRVPCPVLTVPIHAPAHPGPMFFKRILCATDFSPASEAAVRYAASLAVEADGSLLLVHVLDRDEARPRPGPGANGHEANFECAARARLRAALPAESRQWCSVEENVAAGKPGAEILRFARDRDAGLIVMGVHGRGILDLMAFGSVTHEVVRDAACPVLTVRSSTPRVGSQR